jgi:hypothetical protein
MDESYEFFYEYLSNGLFKIFIELYQDSKKIKSPYNHLKNFQLALGETVKWTDVVYQNKWDVISKQSNCDYFDDYLKIIFYTKLKYLIENCILDRQNNNLNLNDYIPPSNIEFLKKVTIYSAKEFYKNPYIFDDKNINTRRINKNRELIKDIISKSIRYVIQLSLPTKCFVNHYNPNELIRKVNELTSMNNFKTIGITQNQTEAQTTLIEQTKKTNDNTVNKLGDTTDQNELIKLYQTMLLNQLVQQNQQQLNLQQNNNHLTLKQHTLNNSETSETSHKEESDKISDSESESKSESKKSNIEKLKSVLTNNENSENSDSNNLGSESEKYIEETEKEISESNESESEKSEKQIKQNLDKEHLLKLKNEIPNVKKESNPTIIKVVLDEMPLSNNIKSIINENNLKKEKNNVNSKSNLSETQKQIAKYTSNKYKKQLKEMNNKLKKVNNNPKINVKEKVEMSPLFHKLKKTNQQKLNDNDIVDINSINNAKKLSNRNHQKTQLDIIKSISVASKHTNFQSLSDNENSTLIQEKLKSEIKVSPNFKKNK